MARTKTTAGWDDLGLPETAVAALRQITEMVRARSGLLGVWFAGGRGEGRTMAAEALATELRLDLYRVDLSAFVSKYIGETEKNLRRVFDAAQESGALLFFDEADALFGKRSDVRDSHDRYANIEVAYLLACCKQHEVPIVLSTNGLHTARKPRGLRKVRWPPA